MGQQLVTLIMKGALPGLTYAVAVRRPLPPPACTTHMTSLIFGFQGDFEPVIAKTVYTTTIVKTKLVPCGGCELQIDTEFAPFWGGPGPVEILTGTTTAVLPWITTTIACSPSKHVGPQPPVQTPAPGPAKETISTSTSTVTAPVPAITKPAANNLEKNQLLPFGPVKTGSDGKPSPGCTYTKILPLSMIHGPMRTVWSSTTTITSHIDCTGCGFVKPYTINGLNHGPIALFDATTTASEPSSTTVYVCLKSPSVIIGGPAASSALHHTKLRREGDDSVIETKTPALASS